MTGIADWASEDTIIDLKGEIKKLQIDLRDRRLQIGSLEKEIHDTESDINHLESEKSKAQARTRALENELRIAKVQVEELLSTTLDNENVIRMKVCPLFKVISSSQDSQIALLQETMQHRDAEESGIKTEDYNTLLDRNHLLEQQIDELKAAVGIQTESRAKAEQAKKNALDQLYTLRQEAEIQREDLYSAELETKKARKTVADANAKAVAQAKELKEVEQSKIELSAKIASLQRSLDEATASTKFGHVEKTRMENEIANLQRRVKTEQDLTKEAEAELSMKNRELGDVKRQAQETSQAKVAVMVEQKQKLESSLKEWQAKHASIASRLDASETQRSRAYLEIEDLVHELFYT